MAPSIKRYQPMDMNALRNIHSEMKQASGQKELASDPMRALYVKKKEAWNKKRDPFDVSSVGDTKASIRSALKGYLGPKRADQVLRKVEVNRFKGKGILGVNADTTSVDTGKLGDIIATADKMKVAADLENLSRSDQGLAKEATKTLNSTIEDPVIGPIFERHCKDEQCTEGLKFHKDFQALKTLVNSGDANNVADARRLAIGLRRLAITTSGQNEINIPYGERNQIRGVSEDAINAMDLNQLKGLTNQVFSPAAFNNQKLLSADTLSRFKKLLLDATPQPLQNSSSLTLNDLKSLQTTMADGSHLRGSGQAIYAKTGHGKQHLWGGKRKQKFQSAKLSVRQTLVRTVGAQEADTIMAPFMNSKAALTKANLEKIIRLADIAVAAQAEIRQQLAAQIVRPAGPGLQSTPQVVSNDVEGDYWSAKKLMMSPTGHQLKGLDHDFDAAWNRLEMNTIANDGTPLKSDVEEVLARLAQRGYTPEQVRAGGFE